VSVRLQRYVPPAIVIALLLVAWLVFVRGESLLGSGVARFPTLQEVVLAFRDLWRTAPDGRAPMLVSHIVASVFRVSSGFLLATAIAVPVGLIMGWYSLWYRALNPMVQILRPISPIAWIPISILLLRNDDPRSIFLIFISTFFPIVVAAAAAVRNIPQVYIRSAANFGYRGWPLFKKVVLPAALPQILTGLRLAVGISWVVVVAAEMIAVESGLGFLITDARNQGLRYDLIVAAMITIGVIGLGLDTLLRRVENFDEVKWGYVQRG
jgi:NitT/TauT family transport system permease protein